MPQLLLASSSSYRKKLLQRLHIPFSTYASNIDESPLKDEPIKEMVARLSEEKALAAAKKYPDHYIIGSDQSAELNGKALCKPHTVENAIAQLTDASGQTILFFTGFCFVAPKSHIIKTGIVTTEVNFRTLTHGEIAQYIAIERPLDCAGSFKSEGLGISLFRSIYSPDPTALMGLPLIEIYTLLQQAGFSPINR